MGYIKSVLKNGLSGSMNQIKSYDISGKINSKIGSIGIDLSRLDVPKLNNMQFENNIKLPAGVDSYISPIASGALSKIPLPEGLGSIPLPEMPDLSSVSADIDNFVSGMGISTKDLGIRSVDDILKAPDLSSLKDVQWEYPVDVNNLPDLSHALDGFEIPNISELKELGVNINSIF